ncbi:MAG: hypothetical protein WDZ48_07555, partial [Pirellulales bacterium]
AMTPPAILSSARWCGALMLAAVACLWPSTAPAQAAAATTDAKAPEAETVRIVAVRAGFAGRFKVGCWTPFEIDLEGGSQATAGRIELTAPDGDGVPSRVHAPGEHDVTLGPLERKTVLLYAKIGQLAGEVSVGFRTPSGVLVQRRFGTQAEGALAGILPSSATLLVSVGSAVSAGEQSPRGLAGVEVAELSDVRRMPSDWWGYEGVDAVFLATGDEEISSQLATNSPQLAALELWVRMGGKLILSVGRQAETVLATGSALLDLAPGRLESIVPLPPNTMLETFANTTESLSSGGPLRLKVPKLGDVRGRVEAFAGSSPRDLPLVVRTPHGFGEVVFVAFDLELPPLANWSARPLLLEKLLGRTSAEAVEDDSGALGAVTTLGFVDLAGQLRGALDQFAGVRLVPFWLVAVLVSAYIVCIGPLDYYLVKRVLRREEATWLTFALTVILFSAGACGLAYGLKGRQLRVNQVDVVDFDAQSHLVRGTSWAQVFSPENETYDLSLAPNEASDDAGAGMLFSWFGLPGGGFGGMDVKGRQIGDLGATSRGLPPFGEAYDFTGRLDALKRVPIAVWSSKAFVGRWWRQGDGKIESKLADNGRLVGTLTSHLETPLVEVVLMYDKWAYVIRRLEPKGQIDFETDIDPQTVDTYLRHVTAQGDRQLAPPYDSASFDVPRIVEIMTAHDLAGGEKYTGLANKHQGFSELSDLVRCGRAVLLGRAIGPAARLERDGAPLAGAETENWTFYRFVFPVAEKKPD